MKENDYICPKCKGHLNAGGYVIFSTQNIKKRKGLVLLSPKVGKYEYRHHPDYFFEKGETIEFFCPICQVDLKSSKNKKYASITMKDHNGMGYEVLFSRIAGEKSTYIVSHDDIKMFGTDSLDYEELFEES